MEKSLLEKDAAYIWHPFTQAKTSPPAIPIAKAAGAYLYGCDGRKYFDAISSWWVNLHGHCHPHIAARIASQAYLMDQAIFANFTHAPGANLAERLLKLMQWEKGKVFYTDNGATSVEAALKMALQYWDNRPRTPKRTKIIRFENAYHGDTFGAMSASDKNPYNRPFWPYLFSVDSIPIPSTGKEEIALECLKTLLEGNDVACFIFEPILQANAGMIQHSAEGLSALISLCADHRVLTIADEVMTGFGRTGPLFACDSLSVRPDIVCLSKGLTGGFLTLGAVVCSDEVYAAFLSESRGRAFLHGHSYCGNPIACAAALANLDLLEEPVCELQRERIARQHRTFCQEWAGDPRLSRCESIGTVLALEYREEIDPKSYYLSSMRDRLFEHFLAEDIFLRPFGNVLHVIPPYCTPPEELERTYQCIIKTLTDWK